MTTPVRVSMGEFLAMEETKPYLELIDGEVVEKAVPTEAHATMVSQLVYFLIAYVRRTKEGRVLTEARHLATDERRIYLPDVSVTLASRVGPIERSGATLTRPDFAIAVSSPDDRAGRGLDRVQFFLRKGVQLVWLVDPELRAVFAYRPGVEVEEHRVPDVIDAQPVLKEFTLDLTELFAALDDEVE